MRAWGAGSEVRTFTWCRACADVAAPGTAVSLGCAHLVGTPCRCQRDLVESRQRFRARTHSCCVTALRQFHVGRVRWTASLARHPLRALRHAGRTGNSITRHARTFATAKRAGRARRFARLGVAACTTVGMRTRRGMLAHCRRSGAEILSAAAPTGGGCSECRRRRARVHYSSALIVLFPIKSEKFAQ